jgi:nucleoside-diphosphate-sugar epimerase
MGGFPLININMKKIIFILTYSEGDRWVNYYGNDYEKYFPSSEYQLIFLDNGNQANVQNWAKENNAIYHRSENNLGTTGGYNWFFRIGHLLKAHRIAVLQADVFVHDPLAITYLFNKEDGSEWDKSDFVYWPNTGRSTWSSDNLCGDVGQFFSVDPTFYVENDYLCDENYTITHFESIDLWIRMTAIDNKFRVTPHNLLHLYYPEEDLIHNECKIYSYHSFSNRSGEHNEWFEYNWEYFKSKWGKPGLNVDAATAYIMFVHGFNFWNSPPWTKFSNHEFNQLYLHRKTLDPQRNINVGQVPYPVEYEVNKYYNNFIKVQDKKEEIIEPPAFENVANLNTSVLIIGSSGYIGSALSKYLSKRNYLVTTVDNNMFGGPTPQYKIDYKQLDKEFYKKFSHIILLAGHSSMAMCSDNYAEAWENNVTKFTDLISKLTENQTLIYASSGSVYGQGGESRKEFMTLATAQIEYDLTKQLIEKIALGAKCKTIGLRFGTVNGFNEFARADLMLNAMVINAKTNHNIECFNGINHRSILGINDCVRAIKTIINSSNKQLEQHEIFNIASFSGNINSFAEGAGAILNVPINFHPEITNLFSFELDTSKFTNTFGFTFNETLSSIITELVANYEKIVWSKRVITNNEVIIDEDKFGLVFDNTSTEPVVIDETPTPKHSSSPSIRSIVNKIDSKSNYKKLYNCLCCGNPNLFVILDLGHQSLANSFHKPEEVLEEYELKLMGCDSCWHSQLSIAVDPTILFKNYIYVSGTSNTLKEYFDWFANSVSNIGNLTNNPGRGHRVLDIACNDGTLLDSFKKIGWITYGVDPAENLHPISTGKGHEVTCDFWNVDVAKNLPKMDLIVAQNVFAHTCDIHEFLKACEQVMHNGTVLIIETSQAEMFDKNEFDTIYHEHISYFSISSMKKVVEKSGLFLNGVWKPNVHGKSYSFNIGKSRAPNDKLMFEEGLEKHKYNREFYDNYRNNVLTCLSELKNFVDKNQGKKIIGYGAAAKGMTVINAGDLKLEYIIDDNPLKQGLLCPGSNIPVQTSDILKRETDDLIIIILAWNFYNEIYKKIKMLRPKNKDTFITYFPNLQELK